VYPYAPKDEKTGKPTERGLICKLCDRKFFIKAEVASSIEQIEAQNFSLKGMMQNYNELNMDAKELTKDD